MPEDRANLLRQQMVEIIAAHTLYAREQIGKDVLDPRVLAVMAEIPRHDFVPLELVPYAYADQPLPIGYEKTISQPFIIALMTDLLGVEPGNRVLEVGTGLGYHTAVLAKLAATVFTVEIVEELGEQARKRLAPHGYRNVFARIGNGENGWPSHAPFERIIVCAGVELIPPSLLMQLKAGGRMVIPTGIADQQMLSLVEKGTDGRLSIRETIAVRFAMLETGM
ncbi:protein-L-isoaspartate(D-aspartate) O-methyltransferase [Defluviicoccus vanus]|nr:protein-L-isoaspartate(D-aspartate) O-methyltransferase [Defluviicoccus vanus]